jgi:hypothetical protein
MEIWENFLQQLNSLLGQYGQGNGMWQFGVSLAILIVGLIVLEVLFRFIRRRIHAFVEKKGHTPEDWKLAAFLPPLRLAATALLLRGIAAYIGGPYCYLYTDRLARPPATGLADEFTGAISRTRISQIKELLESVNIGACDSDIYLQHEKFYS